MALLWSSPPCDSYTQLQHGMAEAGNVHKDTVHPQTPSRSREPSHHTKRRKAEQHDRINSRLTQPHVRDKLKRKIDLYILFEAKLKARFPKVTTPLNNIRCTRDKRKVYRPKVAEPKVAQAKGCPNQRLPSEGCQTKLWHLSLSTTFNLLATFFLLLRQPLGGLPQAQGN